MRKKAVILWTIMLVVGGISIIPMSGSAATEHVFYAYDETLGVATINNATDSTNPNNGSARMYNLTLPSEVAGGTLPDPNYPGTSDLVGWYGLSNLNNSFLVDTNGFDTDWVDGATEFVFIVEKDPGSGLIPMIYQAGTAPNGYVASVAPVVIDAVDDPQEVGYMTLEKIPSPSFITSDGVNYTLDWPLMSVPNIGSYVIYNSSFPTGPWYFWEEVVTPPSTLYIDSGEYYSIGINWTGGVMSLVQGGSDQFNTAPDLNWTGEPGFTTDGVSPDTGPIDCRDFEYRVVYSDVNNDPPQGNVELHILNNSMDIAGSPFAMNEDDPGDILYTDGKIYTYTTMLTNASATYSYYFSAIDTWNRPAGGLATVETPGPIVVVNSPPTITITIPAGGESWTGDTLHGILFTANDVDDALAGLDFNIWLNYSTDGSTFVPITSGLSSILTSPYGWTVDLIDSTTVRIYANVTDTCGATNSGMSLEFEIDSTAPTVISIVPTDTSTDIAITTTIVITFSEPMNTTAAEAAVDFNVTATSASYPYGTSWNAPTFDELTLTPSPPLDQYTEYTVTVATNATDDSDPGNPLAAGATSTFRTEDLEPPEIIHTPVTSAYVGDPITITADVTDNVGVTEVKLDYTDTGGNPFNVTMTLVSGTYQYNISAQTTTGTIPYYIWAIDTSGNNNKTDTNYIVVNPAVVVDTEPPEIVHTPVTSANMGAAISITAYVTDNVTVDEVWLNYTDTAGVSHNVSMSHVVGTTSTYRATIPAQTTTGTVTYFIWANDTSNNDNRTSSYNIQVSEEVQQGTVVFGVGDKDTDIGIPGALIKVYKDSELIVTVTANTSGYYVGVAGFTVPYGDYTYEVTADGYDSATGSFTVDSPTQTVLVYLTKSGVFPWWVIIVLVVIIIVILVLFLLLRKKKKPEEEETLELPEEEEAEVPAEEEVEELLEEEAPEEELEELLEEEETK